MTDPLMRGGQGRDEQHLEDTVATFKWTLVFCMALLAVACLVEVTG